MPVETFEYKCVLNTSYLIELKARARLKILMESIMADPRHMASNAPDVRLFLVVQEAGTHLYEYGFVSLRVRFLAAMFLRLFSYAESE